MDFEMLFTNQSMPCIFNEEVWLRPCIIWWPKPKVGSLITYMLKSTIAKPFFEIHNFFLMQENIVQRNGVILMNYTVEKY